MPEELGKYEAGNHARVSVDEEVSEKEVYDVATK